MAKRRAEKRPSEARWPLAAIRHQAYKRLFARGRL
jgi:hypothetical protein